MENENQNLPYLPPNFNPTFDICPFKKEAIKNVIELGLINEKEPVALVYDCTRLEANIKDLLASFPKHFTHTMAVKSNNVIPLMKKIHSLGMGFESASYGELQISSYVTKDPSKLVFDSPTKTKQELEYALELGAYINVDNFQELEIVKEFLKNDNKPQRHIGIRINPQAGIGSHSMTSTAGQHSKFGIAITDYYDKLIEVYSTFPDWLNGVHVHVGSQFCSTDLVYKGIKIVCDFVTAVNNKCKKQKIKWIDIGGGLPVNFESDAETTDKHLSFKQYWNEISKIEELSSGKYQVLTEFGRRINSKSGVVISRIEYVKVSGGLKIALQHAGADLYIRSVYHPDLWPLRVSVFDSKGNFKAEENMEPYNIAGPCCFAADVIAHKRLLPKIEQGDYIMIHDSGAYCYSSFSYYNFRQLPQVITYERDEQKKSVKNTQIIKKRPTYTDLIKVLCE